MKEAPMRRILIILSVLLALLPVCCLAQDTAAQTILVATDMHYISPALTDHGEYFTRMIENGDGKLVMYCDELMDAFIDEVISAAPACLILSGDITFNGAKQSHIDLADKLRRITAAGIPVYVLPGNHDIDSGASASFSGDSYTRVDNISQQDFESIYHDMGFDAAIARDPHSLSYIAEPYPGMRVLMLDVNTPGASCAAAEGTLLWLEEQLAIAQQSGAKVIAVSHQNLFLHNQLFFSGYLIRNMQQIRDLYNRYGVRLNLSGHLHIQHSMQSTTGLREIAGSSLAVSPCQYGVLTIAGDQAQYRTQAVDVSAWAQRNGKTDENLLHFAEFADAFFRGSGRQQTQTAQSETAEPDAAQKLIGEINAAYFSGRLDTLPQDLSPLEAQLSDPDGFFSTYLNRILDEPRMDHTRLDLQL